MNCWAAKCRSPDFTPRIDDITTAYQPEKIMQGERWNWSGPSHFDYVATDIKTWIANRHPLVEAQLVSFREAFRIPVELSLFATTVVDSDVRLTWRTESEEDNVGFLVFRRVGLSGDMTLIASYDTAGELVGAGTTSHRSNYSWVDQSPPGGEPLFYQLKHVDAVGDTTTINWIEPAYIQDYSGLCLNELMADNEATLTDECGEADDWFEILNTSGVPINLAGCFVTDDLSDRMKHPFTEELVIAPGGRLVLWADNETAQGPLHVAFALSSDGEELALIAPDGMTVLDYVGFDIQFEDHVYMRDPDGTGPWTHGWEPTPGAAKRTPSGLRVPATQRTDDRQHRDPDRRDGRFRLLAGDPESAAGTGGPVRSPAG